MTAMRFALPVLVLSVACARSPDVDKFTCTSQTHCPSRYVCTGSPGSPGVCIPTSAGLDAPAAGGADPSADAALPDVRAAGGGGTTGTAGASGRGGIVGSTGGALGGGQGVGGMTGGGGSGDGGTAPPLTGTGGAIGGNGIGGSPTGGLPGVGGSNPPGTGGGSTPRGTGGNTPPGTGGSTPPGTGGSTPPGTGGAPRGQGPCDIYAAASPATPCVAAYSMVRALSRSYSGPLFQVRSPSSSTNNTMSGGITQDIGMLADGYADTAAVDANCGANYCTVSVLYDQSGNGNHLKRAPKGRTDGGPQGATDDYESIATKGAVTAGGHRVYSLYMNKYEGYRTAVGVKGTNMPIGAMAQGIYELADGTHAGTACCWNFGNVSLDPMVFGIVNALNFGTVFWGKGAGNGPWFLADFEGGLWAGGSKKDDPGWGALNELGPINPNNPSLKVPFAFGVLKTQPTSWALRMADAATASSPVTAYEGALPKTLNNLGGIVLGVGADNSNNSNGTFYEGAIVSGFPSDATDLAVFQNVQAVGYTK